MSSRIPRAGASLIAALVSLPVFAQQDKSFWMETDRAALNVGGFVAEFQTDIRSSSDLLGLGTKLSLEDDLGLEGSRNLARIDGYYRFSARHRIDYGWLDISRDGVTRTKQDIDFGDLAIPAGSRVESEFGFVIIKVAYSNSFFLGRKMELGWSVGMIGLDVDGKIDAGVIGQEDGDGFAPFPVFGFRLNRVFGPKLVFRASIEYFEINEGDVDGRVIDALIALEHKTWKKVGLGVGYNSVDFEAENTDDNDEFRLEYKGLLLYAKIPL